MLGDKKSYEIVLDRYLKTDNLPPVFTQFDTETAQLTFKFLEKGVPFIIPYTRLVLVVKKPDKKEVYQDIEIFSGNTAELVLKNQVLTVAGELNCQIKMYQGEALESTWLFKVKVQPSIGNEDLIESSNEYQTLQQLFIDVDEKVKEIDQSINDNIIKNNSAVEKNINDNNIATQQNIAAMKSATDAAIKSIDGSTLGQLNNQVLEPNYQTFIATRFMSRVGENNIQSQTDMATTLELTDEDHEQLEVLDTPSTMEEELEDHPTTLEEPMPKDSEATQIESGFAKSAILEGQTLVNLRTYAAKTNYLTTTEQDDRILKITTNGAVSWGNQSIIPLNLKPTTKYIALWDKFEYTNESLNTSKPLIGAYPDGKVYNNDIFSINKNFITFTTTEDISLVHLRVHASETNAISNTLTVMGLKIIEYVEGMENWDIPYFDGMQSVVSPNVKTVNKNLFDGEVELGTFDISGNPTDTVNCIRAKNFQNTEPNTKYVFSNDKSYSFLWVGYTKEKEYIGEIPHSNNVITTPSNCYYVKFRSSVQKVQNDISVKIQMEKGEIPTTFETHKSTIVTPPSTLILRGLPNGVCDTLDLITGEYVQRIGERVLESSSYGSILKDNLVTGAWSFVDTPIPTKKPTNRTLAPISDKIPVVSNYNLSDVGFYENVANFVFYDKTVSTKEEFIQKYGTITYQYELATPIVTKVDLTGLPFFFKEGHILLSSGSEDQSLLPTLEYTVPTNLRAQSDNNAESLFILDNEKVDIKSVDKDAMPNSIAKRDGGGDLTVATAVIFKGRGSMGIDPDKGYPVFKDKENAKYDIWNAKNVPIERGTWTPTIIGTTSGKMDITTRNCFYNRIGNIVNIHGEITIKGAGNAVGNANISNLPFVPNGSMSFAGSIGDITNVAAPNLTFGLIGFGGNTALRFRQRNISSGSTGSTTVGGLTPTGGNINIVFSAYYNHG